MKLQVCITSVLAFLVLTGVTQANEELAKEIKYISNDGTETKSEIICINSQSAFMYENNVSKEIRLEQDGVSEDLGKVTVDEAVDKACR